jgi:5-hydroxyisourate hydrolase
MSGISTHVLDAVLGRPAAAVGVRLEQKLEDAWVLVGESSTDIDGRCRGLWNDRIEGHYRLTLSVDSYFKALDRMSIYSEVIISFYIEREQHYHLPLLLSDNSYTTYRGS